MRRTLSQLLLNGLTLLSLLLCVAATVMWVRGYRKTEFFWHDLEAGVGGGFAGSVGQFRFYVRTPLPEVRQERRRVETWEYNTSTPPLPFGAWRPDTIDWEAHADSLGFHVWVGPGDEVWRYRMVVVPCWVVTAALATLPAARAARCWQRRRTSRRAASGLCPACGYDLRATPNQCPECGRVPSAAA